MTNLELAQQQGNQAAPNLLDAAAAGELGGSGSLFPSLNTAGHVTANARFILDSDQADEAAANAIYANYKLMTDNHLDFFELTEQYRAEGAEPDEVSFYYYFAFSARVLAHIKNLALAIHNPEIFEIFDNIEPDVLCTFDDPVAENMPYTMDELMCVGAGELPPTASGVIYIEIRKVPDELSELVPEGSMVYAQVTRLGYNTPMASIQYYAESELDTPVKLDKAFIFYPDEYEL